MSALRRYEMLLPQSFNDGTAVPREFFAEVLLELRSEFGAVSSETQVIQGRWEFQGAVFHDDLIRVFVDVPDTPRNREFFLQFKRAAKTPFSATGHLAHNLSDRIALTVCGGVDGRLQSRRVGTHLHPPRR